MWSQFLVKIWCRPCCEDILKTWGSSHGDGTWVLSWGDVGFLSWGWHMGPLMGWYGAPLMGVTLVLSWGWHGAPLRGSGVSLIGYHGAFSWGWNWAPLTVGCFKKKDISQEGLQPLHWLQVGACSTSSFMDSVIIYWCVDTIFLIT